VAELLSLRSVAESEYEYVLPESEVARELRRAYSVSAQLAVLKALKHFYMLYHRGAAPMDILRFLRKHGVDAREGSVRSALSRLAQKGLVIRRMHLYFPRMDVDPESVVDLSRARAAKSKYLNVGAASGSPEEEEVGKEEYRYAKSVDELTSFGERLVKKIEHLIRDGEREKALGYILYFGAGLRPSGDKVLGIGLGNDNQVYVVIYESKLKRLRLVSGEEGFMHELMKYQLIYNFIRDIIEDSDAGDVVFELDDFEISSSVLGRSLRKILGKRITWFWIDDVLWRELIYAVRYKRLARSVWLSYADDFDVQLRVLGEVQGLPVVRGMFSNVKNAKFYVRE